MKIAALSIPEVLLLTPKKHDDGRGYFVETYNKRSFAEAGIDCTFVQDNQSCSTQRGTIRGLHFQSDPSAQAKLVRVLHGAIYDVAVDLRQGSPTYGRWCGATLSADEGQQLFVPVGFAHAFCTLGPNTIVAYKVDGYYDRSCEGGLHWDDPDIAIDWPIAASDVHLSEKDAQLPYLRDFASPFVFRP